MRKLAASLSLDLDNLWSYMRIHGDEGWREFPSYLNVVVPRILDFLSERDLTITVFIVGKDAAIDRHGSILRSIADAGHEIGNHSHMHEPWLHRYTREALDTELMTAHDAINAATGASPRGFRGPGFSLTPQVLESLVNLGYVYDTTSLPTYIGPLARWYYFRGADLAPDEAEERSALFGAFSDGFKPNRPHRWNLEGGSLMEIPVTTFPVAKVPFHFSYLLYVSGVSPNLAERYFAAGLAACRRSGLGPTMLLHPLDFLDASDAPQLGFFPAMGIDASTKLRRLDAYLDRLEGRFDILPVGAFAEQFGELKVRTPR